MSFLFGSTGAKPSASPKLANQDHRILPSNQRGIPLRYVAGIVKVGVTWLGPAYNERSVEVKQKVGKKSEVVGHNRFATVAGLLCWGGEGVDAITVIEMDGEIVWTGNVTRGAPGSGTEHFATITVPSRGTVRIYWGTAGQPTDSILSGFGHPAYRRQCYIVCEQLLFGQDKTTAPAINCTIWRKPQVGSLLSTASHNNTDANPVHAALELIIDPYIGAGWDAASLIDLTSWDAAALSLHNSEFGISIVLDREEPLQTVLVRILEYFGGYLVSPPSMNGKVGMRLARPFSGDPASLVLIGEYDLVEIPKLEPALYHTTKSEVYVAFTDRDAKFEGDSEPWRSAPGSRIRGREAETLQRPWITRRAVAAAVAAARGRIVSVPGVTIRIESRRREVAGLRAGDFCRLTYEAWNVTLICRVTRRRVRDWRSATVELDLSCEGWWSAVLPYQADDVPSGSPPLIPAPGALLPGMPGFTGSSAADPTPCFSQRLVELPYDLVPHSVDRRKPQLLAMVARATSRETRLVISTSDDGTTYSEVAQTRSFHRVGLLGGTIGATPLVDETATGIVVGFSAFAEDRDAAGVPASSAAGLPRGDCLVLINEEWIAYRDVEILSSTSVRLTGLRRAQFESIATGHLNATEVWFVRREDIFAFTAPGFEIGATAYVKAAPATEMQALDLADVDAMTKTLGLLPISPYVTPPSVDPPTGTFSGSVTVSVAVESGLVLRYTTDGSAVRSTSPEWPKSGGVYTTLTVSQTATLRLRTFNDRSWYSEEVLRVYTSATTSGAQVATPAIAKVGRRGVAGTVTISCATSGATIKYRIDGGSWTTYSTGFALSAGSLVEAYASKTSFSDSEIAEFNNVATAGGGGGGVEP